MKLIIFLAIAGISSAAKLDNTYLPPSHATSSAGSHDFLQAPGSSSNYQRNAGNQGIGQNNHGNYAQSNANGNQNGFGAYNFEGNNQGYQERAKAAFERNAAILRLDNENDGETFAYAYETENGISADEHGVATNGVEAEGGFAYTGDDGQVYSIRYTADQNGFVPQGDHLPTPPPIPQEILEALEKNAQDEAAGIFDDGTYDAAKYNNEENNGNNGYSYNTGNNNNNYNQINNQISADDSVVTNNAFIRDDDKGFKSQGGFGNYGSQRGLNQGSQGGFNQVSQRGFNQRSQGGFNQGSQNGFNQGSQSNFKQGSNGVTQAYLPPLAKENNKVFGNRNQQPQRQSYNNQTPFNNQQGSQYKKQMPHAPTGGDNNQAYLPPFESQRSQKSNFGNQRQTHRGSNVNREYLPPL